MKTARSQIETVQKYTKTVRSRIETVQKHTKTVSDQTKTLTTRRKRPQNIEVDKIRPVLKIRTLKHSTLYKWWTFFSWTFLPPLVLNVWPHAWHENDLSSEWTDLKCAPNWDFLLNDSPHPGLPCIGPHLNGLATVCTEFWWPLRWSLALNVAPHCPQTQGRCWVCTTAWCLIKTGWRLNRWPHTPHWNGFASEWTERLCTDKFCLQVNTCRQAVQTCGLAGSSCILERWLFRPAVDLNFNPQSAHKCGRSSPCTWSSCRRRLATLDNWLAQIWHWVAIFLNKTENLGTIRKIETINWGIKN